MGRVYDPLAVGVPERVPLVERLNPGGRALEADHTKGGVPPVAASAVLYGCPVVAEGSAFVTIDRGAAKIVNCRKLD
jgi:hypothetical protein